MIEEINNMEEMVDIAKESTEKFDKLWSPWLVFRYSDHYTQLDMGWNSNSLLVSISLFLQWLNIVQILSH